MKRRSWLWWLWAIAVGSFFGGLGGLAIAYAFHSDNQFLGGLALLFAPFYWLGWLLIPAAIIATVIVKIRNRKRNAPSRLET